MPELHFDNVTTGPMCQTLLRSNSDFRAVSNNPNLGYAWRKIEANRRLRRVHFPSLKGDYNRHSLLGNVDIDSSKRNGDKNVQPMNPHRIYDSLVDPTSGFLSKGCDDGHSHISHTTLLDHIPQSKAPAGQNGTFSELEPGFQLNRHTTWWPRSAPAWNSRRTSDAWIRAKIAGRSDDVANNRRVEDIKSLPQDALIREQAQCTQDKLALSFVYGTSTQRGYEDVPWDRLLRPKRCPPTATGEQTSEIVLYHMNKKLSKPNTLDWQ